MALIARTMRVQIRSNGENEMTATRARQTPSDAGEAPRVAEEVSDYHSDVTCEKVAIVRERARPAIDGDEWEQIDGFGTVAPS